MEYFRLHFFKEKSRHLNIQATIAFFEVIDGFDIEMDESSMQFIYTDPSLKFKARFLVMPKSQVRNIHEIDPNYLDLNFQLEVPTLVPDYFFEKMLRIAKKLVDRFDYFIYHESLKNVRAFKHEYIFQIYQMIKDKYLELNPSFFKELVLVPKTKLNSIYRYIDDMLQLQKHYSQDNTYVPHYFFFVNQNRDLKVTCEWTYDTLTVLPANLDYIILNRNGEATFIEYKEFYNMASKYLEPVPGFIKDTYFVPKKNLRKITKILRSNKYSKVLEKLTKVDHMKLID